MKSLYIHIPFCRAKCLYCDFYSTPYSEILAQAYLTALCIQIKSLGGNFCTIYIGGGTPTVFGLKQLKVLLKSLRPFSKKTREFTIEANPESLDMDKIKLFLDEGVNRISIGVQSLYDSKLKKLGRIHCAHRAQKAVAETKKAGFKNINIDLIFGVWQETLKSWKKELRGAVNLPIDHISAYSLSYEKTTALYKRIQSKTIQPADEKNVADMYAYALDFLPKAKFPQYEVSNFSKLGYACKHNLNYWQNNDYLGLGPCAVSYIDGVRERNSTNLKDYLCRVKKGATTIIFREKLSSIKKAKETAALKIRTTEGINFEWFKKKTGFDLLKLEGNCLRGLEKEGFVSSVGKGGAAGAICLTRKGFIFCDTVSAAFV